MTTNVLSVPQKIVVDSLASLRDAGRENKERVLLWLARSQDDQVRVVDMFVPDQMSERDFFRIPATGMTRILAHLRTNDVFIGVQVHSHPQEAFHSEADDRWAIVRHKGALSLVVPDFARHTTPENFVRQTAAFSLSAHNEWQLIPFNRTHFHYRMDP